MTDIFKLDTSKPTNELVVKMAQILLQNYIICVKNNRFQICEIEFYINSESHPDTYTHGDPLQKNYGKIYFHKSNGKSYKGGTFKGMDLTFGNENMFFGILIRSMYDIDNKTMICGPCNCVNMILSLNNCSNVGEFMEKRMEPFDATQDKSICFVKNNIPFQDQIYLGTRIGLSDKYPEWKNKLYRFVSKVNLIKKEKKKLAVLG